ncbi:hypothetical protein MJK70_16800 [Klebsiella pneumoniae]|nr:hypothetical protein MJK70_16800 [Klebsiella pneumoniae]
MSSRSHAMPINPAFVNMGELMTFRKLEERSRALPAYLQQGLGLKKKAIALR